jgi:short-subunit dehydrogenase
MSSRIGTVLIIGATAGIGEAFARRFHKLGKNVIAAGRNKDKLKSLTGELNGLETFQVRFQGPSLNIPSDSNPWGPRLI